MENTNSGFFFSEDVYCVSVQQISIRIDSVNCKQCLKVTSKCVIIINKPNI